MTKKERRYGRWAGSPDGEPEDTNRCITNVHNPSYGWVSGQCSRKRGHGPGGLYCKQHGKMEEERLARVKAAGGTP